MDWICSRCGKKIIKREDYYSGLCFDCYKLTYTLNSIPRFLEITICPRCARYKVKDRWVSPKSADQSSMILEAANTAISKILPDDESVVEVKLIPHMEYANESLESKSEIPVSTMVKRGGLKDKNIIVQREVTLTIQKNICPDCSRISRGSYEAIIQIRAKNRQLEEEERVKILNYIYNFIQKNNITSPEHAITKIKESISGFDLYFSSNNLARKISNEVAEEFGCAHKESSKLVGKDKSGKTLFKVVYSLRLPAFRLGDIIEWSGKYYILESIGGGSAQIVDISVNQRNSIPLSETWKISLILPRESLSCFLILAVEDNVIDLMDTKTYETFSVNKPTWHVEPGMELAGFTSRNGEIIIIPRIK